jgi:hypothetical protein
MTTQQAQAIVGIMALAIAAGVVVFLLLTLRTRKESRAEH